MKVLYGVGFHRNFTGSQRSLARLIDGLPARIEPVVVVCGKGRAAQEFIGRNARVDILETPEPLDRPDGALLRLSVPRVFWLVARHAPPHVVRAVRLVRRERPDIIHCNDVRALLQIGVAGWILGVPVFWHLKGRNVFAGSRTLNWLAHTVSTSTISVAHAVAPPPRRNRTDYVIYEGEEPDRPSSSASVRSGLTELLAQRGFERNQTFTFVTVSSFVPYKGLHHVLAALAAIVGDGSEDVRIAWVALGGATSAGQRKYRDHLMSEARRLGVERHMWLAGWVEDALPWMEAADAVVLPSVERETFEYPDGELLELQGGEGFPLTILEAMIARRAVVASDVAGVREQIGDRAGMIVAPGDEAALADALRTLRDDSELRHTMGELLHERAHMFSIEATVEATVAAYDAATQQRRRRLRFRRCPPTARGS